ncbi:sterile alpha motif domain-containing protein 9-like [Arapaima gigas]
MKQKKSQHSVSSVCVTHRPGSGGSTLARHVMWDLRNTLRCAVVEDVTATPQDIARQTIALFKAGGEKKQNTVLLLVDNIPNMESLLFVLTDAVTEEDMHTNIPVVVVLKCVHVLDRDNVTLKTSLSLEERDLFDKKLEAIGDCYNEESKKFYAFNIMQQNFSEECVQNLSNSFLDGLNLEDRSTQLFAVLVLINSYIPGSALLKSECEIFLRGSKHRMAQDISFERSMQPFLDFLVTFSKREEKNKYEFVRVVHPLLAKHFCASLADAGLTQSKITELLLKSINGNNKQNYDDIINQLLVKRREKKKFSDLIETIIEGETEKCVSLLNLACRIFADNAFMRQVMARILYLKVQNYPEAEKWAKKAKLKNPKNSFIADTLGQVLKHHFMAKKGIELAEKAILAFEEEFKLAEEEVSECFNDEGKKHKNLYNNRCLFGQCQVANRLFHLLPEECQSVLRLQNPFNSLCGQGFYKTLLPHKKLLLSLRKYAERGCEFFEAYLTYSKPREHNDPPYLHDEVAECFVKYAASTFEREYLETQSSFSGLLHCLYSKKRCQTSETWEKIVQHYCIKETASDSSSQVLNYLLANVCLSCVDQTSSHLITYSELKSSLSELVRASQTNATPELFFLSLLIFWPLEEDLAEQPPCTGLNIVKLVTQLKKSYDVHYEKYLRCRYLVPLFFLAKGTEWNRLVARSKIEDLLDDDYVDLKWRDEETWKNAEVQKLLMRVNGTVEKREVFACYSDLKIPVRPDNKASVRQPGRVSFYLGFSIEGPVAFDIKYMNICY